MKKKLNTCIRQMNDLGAAGEPFFFIFDFDMANPEVIPLIEINPNLILYNFDGITNAPKTKEFKGKLELKKYPVTYKKYLKAFSIVKKNLEEGNSYLLNLTFPTRIDVNLGLYEIFRHSHAKYKLWFRDRFVFFSPEPFIKICDGKIFSFPMKGTIGASVPMAAEKILENRKEAAEHNTIVDLIRNDLSIVASKVKVESFRYIEEIKTENGNLLQVSSRIAGELNGSYKSELGNILYKLLPAGSVTGAPKEKTVAIIKKAEGYKRGYYTGVAGIFDGKDLTSSVMIRFIEKTTSGFVYKSGGGITVNSNPVEEYEEMVKKVYVPLI